MRHLSAWAAGLSVAVVIGCGPGKDLPDNIPQTTEPGPKPAETQPEVPAKSDPAARAVVDRAIAAHTKNNPERIAQGKVSRSVARGTIKLPVDNGLRLAEPQAVRRFLAVWPDRLKVSFEYKSEITGTDVLLLRPPIVWAGRDGVQTSIPNPRAAEDLMLADALGQHWLLLLFPLADPSAVVFDARKGVGAPPVDTVRCAFPNRPVYQLSFDPASGYLTQIDYSHQDFQGRMHKTMVLSEHNTFGGLVLPTKLSSSRMADRTKVRDVVEQWTVEAWEFDPIPDAAFDPPK